MPTRVAACLCEQLTVSCSGDPAQVTLCHCLACQRRTGSTYGIAAFYPRENVRVAGDATTYTRQSDSGYPVTFYFCPIADRLCTGRPAVNPKWWRSPWAPSPIRRFRRPLKPSMPNTGIAGFRPCQLVSGVISLRLR
jgi:hypothetical protein